MAVRISKEFKVGFFIVLALAIFYWGFNYLKGNDVFAPNTEFYAIYKNTEGLTPAKMVQINGLPVGTIDAIYFHPDLSGRLVVKMKLQTDYPIPQDSKVQIHSSGLLGDKSILLVLGKSDVLLANDDTLATLGSSTLSDAVSEQVAPIKAKAEQLMSTLDTAITALTGFLNTNTQRDFEASFSSLSRTMASLENSSVVLESVLTGNKTEFGSLFKNLASISENLKNNNKNITAVLSNLEGITDSLNKVNVANTFAQVNSAVAELDGTLKKINDGTGTLGQLVNNPELYNNLESAANNLDRLLLDVKYNPKKYVNVSVFGKKGEKYSEEEILEIEKKIDEQQKEESPSK